MFFYVKTVSQEQLKQSEIILFKGIIRELKEQMEGSIYDLESILSASRLQHLVKLRHILIYYLNTDLQLNKSNIAYILQKNHATIISSLKQADINLNFYKDNISINFLLFLRTLKLSYLVNLY